MNEKKSPNEKNLARQRAEVILQVRAGRMTATEAAQALGVSRKTYYEWEQRGLQGMMEALENRPKGRPAKKKDREREELSAQLRELEQQLSLSEHLGELRSMMEGLPSLKDLDPENPYLKDKKNEGL